MKIRVTLTLDIDAKAWAVEYGVDPKDVRQDVRDYITNHVHDHLSGIELLREQ